MAKTPESVIEGLLARAERAERAAEAAHVDREMLDNRIKAQVPRILDMVDGLLTVVEAMGDASEVRRAHEARLMLAVKR